MILIAHCLSLGFPDCRLVKGYEDAPYTSLPAMLGKVTF